jgi:hypothetical protein
MYEYAEHPTQPISELEVFTGHILNKAGVQTSRQRDKSQKLRDKMEHISTWITMVIRGSKSTPRSRYLKELDALENALACVHIGLLKDYDILESELGRNRHGWGQRLQTFKLIAACALIKEVEYLEMKHGIWNPSKGGGYVGVTSNQIPIRAKGKEKVLALDT